VVTGQSGVGKSHLVQAVGRQCCVLGYRVHVTGDLLEVRLDQVLLERHGRSDGNQIDVEHCEKTRRDR
jgi:hypothetical protein